MNGNCPATPCTARDQQLSGVQPYREQRMLDFSTGDRGLSWPGHGPHTQLCLSEPRGDTHGSRACPAHWGHLEALRAAEKLQPEALCEPWAGSGHRQRDREQTHSQVSGGARSSPAMAKMQIGVSGRNKEYLCYGRNTDSALGEEQGAPLLMAEI